MINSGKPGLKTRKVWLVQLGLLSGKAWFNQAFGARVSPEFYFEKMISRALDLHTDQAYGQKKP